MSYFGLVIFSTSFQQWALMSTQRNGSANRTTHLAKVALKVYPYWTLCSLPSQTSLLLRVCKRKRGSGLMLSMIHSPIIRVHAQPLSAFPTPTFHIYCARYTILQFCHCFRVEINCCRLVSYMHGQHYTIILANYSLHALIKQCKWKSHHVHFHLSPELCQDTRWLFCGAVALRHIQDQLYHC